MLVVLHMTRDPVTIGPHEHLDAADARMRTGKFRSLPVVEDGRLVGILTERDLRQHLGHLDDTRVNAAMTGNPFTVTPRTTLERAAELMLERKVSGLPVVEGSRLVGILTMSDVVEALLEVMGASEQGTVRIDIALEGRRMSLTKACRIIAAEDGEVLGLGTYRERWDENPVSYIRMRTTDAAGIADALAERGYLVLGIHGPSTEEPASAPKPAVRTRRRERVAPAPP